MKYYINIIRVLILILSFNTVITAQTVSSLIDEVSPTSLNQMLNEFAGEVTTTVGNNTVTILNRVSSSGNDLAADYLEEKLNGFGNLEVVSDQYSGGNLGGRNIIATQIGETNPTNIFVISAHYDTVANYCANDNATGTAAVLETARILSKYCTNNTIIYALWDEEESGLIGSDNWAEKAFNDNKNILGAINLDMIGYDKDGNSNIPIHSDTNSIPLKDDVVNILNEHMSEIGLTPTVVIPGISSSDHSSFWKYGFKSIMLTDAVNFDDLTPHYHTANDRVSTLNLPYFHKISKYLMAITAEKAGLINNEDCTSLSVEKEEEQNISIYPNPTNSYLNIKIKNRSNSTSLQLINVMGQVLYQTEMTSKETTISTINLADGIYFLKIGSDTKSIVKKIIKN